ncbi:MAG: hypothetical protein IJQ34_07240 [Kiritimatiellae bacterium]|nr:hypothetical protein [Kiritimatiellia bacterium]MBR0197912.1 hypothetical protein [Kiritimatiellia bacterium]
MKYLLDTCTISETAKRIPSEQGDALRRGKPVSFADSQIAATASIHNMTLVTRNVDDMTGMGVPILNPF